ncbi:MAG: methyltransferase domain-containing protein [bacterium]|nr:methyltransferase domain-containing protein [bacterium]
MTSDHEYVHGYSERESERLYDQANALSRFLHHDTKYPAGSRVLEAGCGVGGQTVFLAGNSPDAAITSVDISPESLDKVRVLLDENAITNVTLQQGNIFDLAYPDESFDHVFVCFVLEHLEDPVAALAALKRVLKPGGTITVIEGDHGSFYCYPETSEAMEAVQCLVRAQAQMGGDSLIGRRVYPLMAEAGFKNVGVTPRMIYVDASKPDLIEGFSRNTFTAMVEGVGEQAVAEGMMTQEAWDKGIADMYRAASPEGTFCYTFFKGVGLK